MELPRDGQEYAHLTFTDLPFNTVIEVSVDNRVTWNPTEADGSADRRRILLRGPDSDRTEGLLIDDYTYLWIRVADTPEVVVRNAGTVSLT